MILLSLRIATHLHLLSIGPAHAAVNVAISAVVFPFLSYCCLVHSCYCSFALVLVNIATVTDRCVGIAVSCSGISCKDLLPSCSVSRSKQQAWANVR